MNERAFAALYDEHTPALYGLALRLAGGNARDAEDIVHEAWMRAVGRLADFAGRSALRTWLCGFVVNCWREMVRRRGDREWPLDEAPEPGAEDGELTGTFDRLELERGLQALAPGYREVLVLHDVEGYSHEEIAVLRGVAIGTSKSQLARARRALRRMLT
jgi:RNA polymerase sigma-70 factor (ECF subfamily)